MFYNLKLTSMVDVLWRNFDFLVMICALVDIDGTNHS